MEKSDGLPGGSDGQSCPALQKLEESALPNDGTGEVMRVIRVPVEKLPEIEETLARYVRAEPRLGDLSVADMPLAGENLPKKSAGGKWMLGAKLAGLVIVAACVTGELSTDAPEGQSIHAHGGHENKRSAARRPLSGTKNPDNDVKPDGGGPADDGGGASTTGDIADCVHVQRVDWCEHRIDDCFCWQRQRRCRWDDGGLTATMTSGFQDVKGEAVLLAEGHHAQPIKAESGKRKAVTCTNPRYALRKGLGCWELVFAGRKATINDGRGVHIVAYLLRNPPPERLHAMDLEKLVWAQGFVGEKAAHLATEAAAELEECHLTVRTEPGGMTRSADDNELLKREVRELLAIVRDDTLPAAEREEAQDKLDEISRAMSGSKGISRDAAQSVERVRKAILRLHEQLACAKDERQEPHEVLLAFGEHVRKYLIVPSARFTRSKTSRNQAGVAGTFTYEPPPGVKWS
jgi:hypothetical protein